MGEKSRKAHTEFILHVKHVCMLFFYGSTPKLNIDYLSIKSVGQSEGLNIIIIWICSSALITLYQVRNISCLWRQSTNTKRKKRFTKKNLPHSWLRCACLRVDFCDAHRSTDWRYRPLHARTFRFYSAGSPAPPSPHFHEANGLLVCSSTLRSSLHVFNHLLILRVRWK